MDTIEHVCQDVEKLLADINSSGVGNIAPDITERLLKLSSAADSLDMKTGKKLIDNLLEVLKSFKDGKAEEGSVSVRLTALDFYQKKVLSSLGSSVEDI
jgi:hypothetical protein